MPKAYADKIVALENGRIAFDGSSIDYKDLFFGIFQKQYIGY
jgi:ABC-type phosphate/phosphonate transport system ATPase subunit